MKTLRIVIADNESIIRMDLKEILQEAGHEVVGEAIDGYHAVELTRKYHPDLVIMDIKMPEMDGITASKIISDEGLAPVLLLTARPADYLSSAYIQCVAYSGSERNAEYQLDAQDCDGPVDEQIRQAFNFVKRNMRVEAVKRPGRIDIPQYDLAAVFEAIVNAVAHRDYAMHGARIRLHLFADRLELSTPGGLPNSLTVDSMEANSITRNETLVNLLSRYYPADPVSKRQNLIERRGEGVPTILTASENLSLRRPRYEQIDHTELKLTLYAASREKNGLLAQFTSEE